jgi:endonuclease/exonuclease/phosphatase family metal-dependent hydrolase
VLLSLASAAVVLIPASAPASATPTAHVVTAPVIPHARKKAGKKLPKPARPHSARAAGYGAVYPAWKKVKGAKAYLVQASYSSSFSSVAASRRVSKGTTTTTLSGLRDGAKVYFRVGAVNKRGTSWSKPASATTLAFGIASDVGHFRVTSDSASFHLSWERPSTKTTAPLTYRVYAAATRSPLVDTGAGSTAPYYADRCLVGTVTSAARSVAFAWTPRRGQTAPAGSSARCKSYGWFKHFGGSLPGETFRFLVDAYHGAKNNNMSGQTRVLSALVPGTPSGVTVSGTSPTGFTLRWPSMAANARWYEAQVATDDSFTDIVQTAWSRHRVQLPYLTVSSLQPATTYYVRVRSDNGIVTGPWSDVPGSITTTPATTTAPIRVGSFNIRLASADTGTHAWSNRKTAVANIIKTNFDLVGLQEDSSDASGGTSQAQQLASALPGYGTIDGKSELHLAYKTSVMTPTGSALGDTFKTTAPTYTAYPYVAQRFTLNDGTGREFVAATVHLAINGTSASRVTAVKSALSAIRGYAAGLPIVLTGDFNEGLEDETIPGALGQGAYGTTGTLTAYGNTPEGAVTLGGTGLINTEDFAENGGLDTLHEDWSSNSAWNSWSQPPTRSGYHLDQIMTTQDIGATGWKVIPDTDLQHPASDHFPIEADLVFPDTP